LQKGPVTLMQRDMLNPSIESVVIHNVWDYQCARPGLIIPILMRAHSHFALKQGELLDIFVPCNQQEKIFKTYAHSHDQEIENLAIYTRQVVKALENGIVSFNDDINNIKAKVSQPYSHYKKNLKQYEQAFISVIQNQQASTEQARNSLKKLQRVLQLRCEDIERIEAYYNNINLPSSLNENIKLTSILSAPNKKIFLLTASIVATFIVLLGFFDEIARKKQYLPQLSEFSPLKALRREE